MNKFTKLGLFTLLLATVVFSSCKKEYETIESVDDTAIQTYLKQNNLSFTKDPTKGYYYKITTQGTGSTVANQDSVYYSYSFRTLSGTVFYQSTDLMIPSNFLGYTDRFTFNQTQYLLTPVREVLTKLNRGGKATLIMPSYMAFGKNGISSLNIESNANILVDLGIYSESKRHEIDELEINKFIANNNLTLIKDPSRARYSISTPGTGTDPINVNSTLVANYTLRTLDGVVVQTSTDGSFTGVLGDLVKGWKLILPGKITAGGKIRLILPSDLGYGSSPLDFDIEIVKVTN